MSEQRINEWRQHRRLREDGSAPYTTAMIISGNNQNFLRFRAKRPS